MDIAVLEIRIGTKTLSLQEFEMSNPDIRFLLNSGSQQTKKDLGAGPIVSIEVPQTDAIASSIGRLMLGPNQILSVYRGAGLIARRNLDGTYILREPPVHVG